MQKCIDQNSQLAHLIFGIVKIQMKFDGYIFGFFIGGEIFRFAIV